LGKSNHVSAAVLMKGGGNWKDELEEGTREDRRNTLNELGKQDLTM